MANFKIGQRVRIVAAENGSWAQQHGYVGREATVMQIPGWLGDCRIECDGNSLEALFIHLSPITPPIEEAWAREAVRKVTKPQPVAPMVPEKLTA
jgi:hypothetical protein